MTTQEMTMLYNRLSDTELERTVYIDLTNQAARVELVHRTAALMDTRSDEHQDLEMQLEVAAKDHAAEIEAYEESLDAAGLRERDMQRELDEAHARIARLSVDLDRACLSNARLVGAKDLV